MPTNPVSIDGEFDSVVLEDRRDLAKRYEALALAYGDFRSTSGGHFGVPWPVVVAPAVESQWTFDSSSSNLFGGDNSDLLAAALDRSGLSADQLPDNAESINGVLNSAVGSAFELDVNGMFDAGELPLPDGATGVRLLGRTHPGADFEFVNDSGDVVALMNTKASSGYSIISEHFEKYPEVNYVFATHDAAMNAAEHGYTVIDAASGSLPLTSDLVVVDVGTESTEYQDAFFEMAADQDGGLLGFLDGDSIVDNLPWITLGVLAYRTINRRNNGMEFSENKKELIRDSMTSGTVYGVSGALQALGVPMPITITTSMFSSAVVRGVFRARDDWASLVATESALVASAEAMSRQ